VGSRELKNGIPGFCESPYRAIKESEGRESLDYGAESHQVNRSIEMPDIAISDELSIQSKGSVDRNAVRNFELGVMQVEKGLPVSDTILIPN
jgi:hypothetical protein